MVEKIFEDAEIEVYFGGGTGETVVLSFASRGYDFAKDGIPAYSILSEYGYVVFGIIAKRINWYPASSMAKLAEVLRPLLSGYDRRLAYGSSMGAYGALKYSALLGCDYVLALAPQYSIDPEQVSKWDGRYHKYFLPNLNEDMEIRSEDLGGQITVIADLMYKLDTRHARKIAEQGPITIVPGYGCGHLVIQPLASRKVLGLFLEAMMAGDIAGAKAIYRKSRKASAYYRGMMLLNLATRHLNRNKPDAALAAIEASIASYDKHFSVFAAASKIHTLRKDFPRALQSALQAQRLKPRSPWLAELVQSAQEAVDAEQTMTPSG